MLCRACRAELGKGSKKPGEPGERDRQMDERGCSMGTAPKGHDSGAGTLAWETGPPFFTVPVIPWKNCFASLGLSFSMCQAGSKGGIGPEGF